MALGPGTQFPGTAIDSQASLGPTSGINPGGSAVTFLGATGVGQGNLLGIINNIFGAIASTQLRAMFSSKMIIPLFAQDAHPPASNYATFVVRNGVGFYRFAQGAPSNATLVYLGFAPEYPALAGGGGPLSVGITFNLWVATKTSTTTSASLTFTAAVSNLNQAVSLDSFTFGAATSVTITSSGTDGTRPASGSAAVLAANLGGLTPGSPFVVKIIRTDSVTDDADLIGIECRSGS